MVSTGGTCATGLLERSLIRPCGRLPNLELPAIKPMTAGAFAPTQRDAGQPKDEKDDSQDPQEMYREPAYPEQ